MIPCNRRHFLSLATSAGAAACLLPSCTSVHRQHLTYAGSLTSACDRIISTGMDGIRDAADRCAETILNRGTCFIAPCSLQHGTIPDIPYLPPLFKIIRSRIMADASEAHDIIISAGLPDEVGRAHGRGVPVIAVAALMDGAHHPEDGVSVSVIGNMPGDGTVSSPYPLTDAIIGAIAGEAYTRSGGIGQIGYGAPETARRYLEAVRERIMTMDARTDAIHEAAMILMETLRNGATVYIVDTTDLFLRDLAGSAVLPQGIAAHSTDDIAKTRIDRSDCVLYMSMTSDTRENLTSVSRLTASGATLITVCPHNEGGGFRAYKKAAVSIDNGCPGKTGIIPFDGGRHHFLHSGHIVNTAAAWNIIGETVRLLSGSENTA